MEGPVKILSKHFMERWEQRRGTSPSLEYVNLICRKGQCIKHGERMWRSIGGTLYEHKTVTMYWHPREQVIIWVDPEDGTAITLIVPVENGAPGIRLAQTLKHIRSDGKRKDRNGNGRKRNH